MSRGGFSGGNFNLTASSGSNFRTRGTSFVFNSPTLEWTDRAAQAVGTEYTNLSLGGVFSGPISYNRSFYSLSYQLGRQSRDNATLLNTTPLGFLTAGVAADSVKNLLGILAQRGLSTTAGGLHPTRLSDNGSLFGNVTFSPPTSSSGQSVGLTYNANWSRQNPAFGGATSLASASGDRISWTGGLQGRHSGYIGNTLSESQATMSVSRNYGTPYLTLPAGNVRVSSDLPDGASGVSNLTFGGSQSLSSTSQSTSAGVQNILSWFDNANKHRLKLETEFNYNGSSINQSANRLGTFTFNSLSDLANGAPASFTRNLTAYDRVDQSVPGRRVARRFVPAHAGSSDPVRPAHRRRPLRHDAAVQPRHRPRVRRAQRPCPVADRHQSAHRVPENTRRGAGDLRLHRRAACPARRAAGQHRRVQQQSERRSHRLGARQHGTRFGRAADHVRRTGGADSELVSV